MNIQFHSAGFTADQKLLDLTQKKLEKLSVYFDKIIDADVYLKLDSHSTIKDKIMELKINVPNKTIFVSEVAATYEAAVDMVYESAKRQLSKHKEMLKEVY